MDAASVPGKFLKHIANLARQIWEGHDFGGVDSTLIQSYGNRLQEGITKGFGQSLVDIDFDTPDHELVTTLLNNTWQFSTAKTYTQLRDMTEALIGPDGKIRSWPEYRQAVGDISGKHLGWLRTEYDSAIGGAQMAKKWKELQDQKDMFPYLQFDAVRDKRTTAICNSLDGVTLPVDDPFWNTYYPPNHFNCRSTVRQLRTATPTPPDQIVYPENVPAMFEVNLGQRGLAFPTDHAYFEGMPAEVYTEARRFFPYQMQFDRVPLPEGHQGVLRRHFMADTAASDYDRILAAATDKARDQVVDVLPTFDPHGYPAERAIIFKGAKRGKSPDLRIAGTYAEEEIATNPDNFNNIKHAVSAGAKQANHVIVTLPRMPADYNSMARAAKGRFIDYKDLSIVEFRIESATITFKREDLIK